jgi:glycosyltransferase involved in cell wall biosynthesis
VVFATHPIQNHAPWFRALVAEGVDLMVFFSLLPDARQQAVGFGGAFSWDTPLLEGYDWVQLQQAKRDPALGSFRGLRNREVGRTLARHAPDVVVLTGWHALPLLQGVWAALLLGIPRVIRGDSNALRPRASWKSAGHRTLFSLYDAFVGMGTANRALYEANGVPPERIFDGGHFVDDQFFLAEARREGHHREKWRSAWGVPPEACCLLFAGKLQEKKRPLDFIRAVATAAARLSAGTIHGLVAGSGDLEPQARDLAASLGAPVTFTGFLNQGEIGRAYAAADALVLPSDFGETWGLVVNEGMLFGLPAVVSDRVGCGPDLVKDGETGFVFPFGDVAAVAACMERLASDRSGRMAMGQRARERVLGYSPARGARATIAAARLAMGL